MANPSISVPDELLDEFDDEIINRKADGDLPRDASRSQVIAKLMEGYVEGNLTSSSRAATPN
ncbi:MAG: CopG family ribbon-helix-helix protein [Halopenitus sp.]